MRLTFLCIVCTIHFFVSCNFSTRLEEVNQNVVELEEVIQQQRNTNHDVRVLAGEVGSLRREIEGLTRSLNTLKDELRQAKPQ